jgi:hypothetical protein
MQVETGESFAVADADFAAVASPQEAESVVSRIASLGERCVTVACQEAICTLHPARFAF